MVLDVLHVEDGLGCVLEWDKVHVDWVDRVHMLSPYNQPLVAVQSFQRVSLYKDQLPSQHK